MGRNGMMKTKLGERLTLPRNEGPPSGRFKFWSETMTVSEVTIDGW